MKLNKHTLRCLHEHFGEWMMHGPRFWQLHDFIMGENIVFEGSDGDVNADLHDPEEDEKTPEERQRERDMRLVTMTAGGVMIIPIEGTIMRGVSSFGGTSSVQIRRILRDAKAMPEVKGVMLAIDSPGGTVAGTDELAGSIKAFGQVKTIHTHVNGLMASAAFWTGSQVSRITATRTSEVGSLGTVAVVHDQSELAKKEGIKVHVISTGPHKGAFTPGSEVTEEQLADLQSIVDKLNVFFMEAVAESRNFSDKEVKNLFDGRVHVAADALKLGLIDGISTFEESVRALEMAVVSADEGADDETLVLAEAQRQRRRV